MRRVFVQSFGCRASQADGASVEAAFEDRGFRAVRSASDADLVVFNTCTVTRQADVETRRLIRNVHRDHPETEILVTGCYAQRAPEELTQLEGVRSVIGNSHKARIADLFCEPGEDYHGRVLVEDFARGAAFDAAPVRGIREDRTRPNLKVHDGCSNRCSFCIIPSVRGPSRSASLESVLTQVGDLANRYAEIVLTGINLGRWGRDLPAGLRFVNLLQAILDKTAVRRLRISSVEPMDWSDELLALVAREERIAKHVHIPLQSGSDAVLKRMYRKYRTRHYATRLELAHRLMPDAAVGADVMAGFPGETEQQFEETLRFIEELPFTYLHVFTYSERPGTPASQFGEVVPVAVRRQRTDRLRELSERKHQEFLHRMLGRTLSAVTLEQRGIALSSNFLKIEMAKEREPNQILDLEIRGFSEHGLRERSLLPVLG